MSSQELQIERWFAQHDKEDLILRNKALHNQIYDIESALNINREICQYQEKRKKNMEKEILELKRTIDKLKISLKKEKDCATSKFYKKACYVAIPSVLLFLFYFARK